MKKKTTGTKHKIKVGKTTGTLDDYLQECLKKAYDLGRKHCLEQLNKKGQKHCPLCKADLPPNHKLRK